VADYTKQVVRESAYRLAAAALDLLVLSVDTDLTGLASNIEVRWVSKVPNSAVVAAEDERSDRDTAARPISV